ncbi:MAG: BamA/TamA family outer membrane protein [Planctomycetes bacterium]|nr:BamA/TamA family outer membrane protein [Planctomycetota bacterium]
MSVVVRRESRGLPFALLLCAGCSVLDPGYLADTPGRSGRPPVEVTVDVVGNDGLGEGLLRKQAEDHLFDLSRDPTRESAAYDAAIEIEDRYRSEGYPVAKVRYEYTPPADEGPWPAAVHVRFVVEEGPLVTVEMTLRGNVAFGTAELLSLWTRKRVGALSLGGTAFVEAEVHAFAEQLRTFYRGHGRLDATVDEPRIEVDLARASAKVAIEIREGPVHTIAAVDVAPALRELLGDELPPPPVGAIYTPAAAEDYRVALRSALRHLGHADPRLDVEATPIAGAPATWHVRVDGDAGPVSTIASVIVRGNDKTMDAVVLGKIDLAAGDRYDGAKIDDGLRRLYRGGLFRKVTVLETPVANDAERIDLAVQVDENPSRALEFLAGYGSYEQLRGGLRFEERNLLGTGRGIAFDNRLSMKGYSTGVTATDDDFLGTGSTLSVGAEYFRREEPSFTDEAAGTTTALAHPLAEGLTARIGYTYRNRTGASAFTALPRDQLVDYVEGKVFVELRNDRRDNLLFPRRGHAEFLSFESLDPAFGSSVDLDRLSFRTALHFALWEPVHLVLRSEQSALWPHEGGALVPLQERWFSGGESSVRSYRESQLGPRDAEGNPVGGQFANLFGAEIRFPIWRTLEAAVFADAGNVGARVQDFSLDDMGYGVGAGLRLLLPIGPVRLDSAWNPDPLPDERGWVLHLAVGYPF